MSSNLSEEFKVEDTIQPVADPVMAQALKDEQEKEDKLKKEREEAEKIIDEINNPDEKIFKVKKLTEKLTLDEELDQDIYFDLVHDLYQAVIRVLRYYARKGLTWSDVSKVFGEVEERIETESDLVLDESFIPENSSKSAKEVRSYIDRYSGQLMMLESKMSNLDDKKSIREAKERLSSVRNNFNQIVSKLNEILK